MKKILFAALIVLLLTAVVVVGLLPVLSRDGEEGTLDADLLNAYGATVNAAAVKAGIAAADKTDITVPEEAVEISTAEAWAAMTSGGTYKLTADITVTDSLGTAESPFGVTVYGNGHTVTVSKPLFAHAGELTVYELNLKGAVTGNGALAATAERVTVKYVSNSASVTGTDTVAGLVGTVAVLNAYYCINTGAVNGTAVAGGLVGNVTKSATLEKCVNGDGTTGAVTATTAAGGLLGQAVSTDKDSAVTVSECVNCAAVTVTDTAATSAAGGIAGLLDVATASVSDCTNNRGAVTGYGLAGEVRNGFGGIIGRAQGKLSTLTVQNCLNSGIITAQYKANDAHNNGVAGILGFDLCATATVKDCCNIGAIRVTGGTVNAGLGGMVGQARSTGTDITTMYLTVEDCVNSGGIKGGRPGGILGVAEHFTGVMLIKNCANSGDVTSPANYAGGVAARIEPNMAATADVKYPVSLIGCSNSGTVTAGATCSAGIFAYCANNTSTLYFKDCSNAGTIKNQQSGGISGKFDKASAVFEGCTNIGDVYSNGHGGGIAGNLNGGSGTFNNCTNYGNVYGTGSGCSGGIAGNTGLASTLTSCTNRGSVIANSNPSSLGFLTGGLVGRLLNGGTFTNCANEGAVVGGNNQTGGIVGEADGATSFTDCQNSGNITSNTNDAAGILARAWAGDKGQYTVTATFNNCVNTGTISGARYAGGIAGWMSNNGTYTGCKNTGGIKAINVAGGIVARNSGELMATSCISFGNVEGGKEHAGGIAGWVEDNGNYVECVNTGDVTGVTWVGGIVGAGKKNLTITSCINLGYVEGGQRVGGIAGSMGEDGYTYKVTGCVSMGDVYNTGAMVTDKSHSTGGIAGYAWGGKLTVQYCLVTGKISANYNTKFTADEAFSVVSALVGYQNNAAGDYTYNTFTGTLQNIGTYGKEILIKYLPGDQVCNQTDKVHHNYSVNSYPFFLEKHNGYVLVTYDDNGKASGHSDLTYPGWHVTSAQVRDGSLLSTLNTATGAGTFEQVTVSCGGESYPVYKDTAELLRTYVSAEHEYDYSKPIYDQNGHWYECGVCGYKTDAEAHQLYYVYDKTVHRQECNCGYKTQKTAHTPVYRQYNELYHTSYCEDCGQLLYEQLEAHSYTACVPSGQDRYHYRECACGARSAQVECKYDRFNVNNEGHLMICECGNESLAGRTSHTVVDSEKYYTDGDSHWKQCVCGHHMEEAAHSSETPATCLKKQICNICGETFGAVNDNAHEKTIVWTTGATQHYGYYPCCGTIVDWTNHTFEDGKCTVCAWECVHTGGTATCLNQATCTYCGEQYGEKDPNNHDTACTVTWDTDSTTNPDIRTKHKGIRTCDAVVEAENHTFANGVCTVCGFDCAAAGCVGDGTETCQQKARCIYCGEECGNHGAHDFDTEHWTHDAENSKHYHACRTPGCTDRDSETACSGGIANCTDQAVCEKCSTAYGALDANNHKNSGETSFAPTVGSESATHDERYTCCNALKETVAHTYNSATGTCTACQYACEHTAYTYTKTDDVNHQKICTVCGLTVTEAHTETTAATCMAPAYCALCDSSYGVKDSNAHNFDSDWTQIKMYPVVIPDISVSGGDVLIATVHYHRCLNAGCTATKDLAICSGSTATCADRASCTVCGNEYGEIASEHTGLETTWSHETVEGVTYHYHYCTVCESKETDRAACAGTAATCTSKAKCSVCDTEFGESDATNHAGTAQSWRETEDGSGHYKVWDCCGTEVENSRENHSYPKNGISYACVCGHACDHTCGVDYENSDRTHNEICKNCGLTEEKAHTFGEWQRAQDQNSMTVDKPWHHWRACACGAKDGYEECIFNVSDTCQALAHCSVCGRSDNTRLLDGNAHVWGKWTETDALTHTRTCTLCTATETVAHCFGTDAVCDDCGYICTHDTTKGVKYDSFANDNQHNLVCQNCNYQYATELHTVGTPADCMKQAVCGKCGDSYGPMSSEHSFDLTNWETDGNSHWHKCTVEGCTARKDESAHAYDSYASNDTQHWHVCICGQRNNDAADHTWEYRFDETGHWQVCTCGKSTADASVAHVFTIHSDARGHWEQCECGANKGGDPIAHTFNAATGICTAEGCNYVCLHSGEFTYVANSVNSNTHDVYCNVCGMKIKEKAGHEFDLMDPHYVCEGNYHWIGCLCGAKLDAENGAIEHSTGAEGDLVATCTRKAYCSICGSYYGELDPDNHATPDAFDYWTDPDDLGRHFKAYDCCGVRVTNEAHTFENGVCKYCDAGCIHTGGNANCKNKAICKICGVAYGELSTTHVYSNACDTDCNACGATRETAHTFGDWVEVLAPTTTAKGKETRTCTVCGVTDTYETDMLPTEEKDHTAVIVVSVVSGSVVGVGAIICVGVWIVKSRAAAKIAASQKPWRTKQPKKKKWKKKLKKKWNKNNNKRGDE